MGDSQLLSPRAVLAGESEFEAVRGLTENSASRPCAKNNGSASGLISYGVDLVDLYHRAASYVDRVLRGEKPGELPVQAPSKFELIVNLKTAKALGLIIPETLLATADEVIQ